MKIPIVGEAVNKLKQLNNSEFLLNSKEIINFRNRIIHAYDGIDDSIVWAIINTHIPNLKVEIEQRFGKVS